jgi:Na+/citrate or Na+/malate symporter
MNILAEPTPEPPSPQIEQNLQGDRNQVIGQISGKTAIGNVEKNVFAGGSQMQILGGNITNVTGSGDIHYQEASHQIRQSDDRLDEDRSS